MVLMVQRPSAHLWRLLLGIAEKAENQDRWGNTEVGRIGQGTSDILLSNLVIGFALSAKITILQTRKYAIVLVVSNQNPKLVEEGILVAIKPANQEVSIIQI